MPVAYIAEKKPHLAKQCLKIFICKAKFACHSYMHLISKHTPSNSGATTPTTSH